MTIKEFFLPRLNRRFFLRLLILAVVCWGVFGFLLKPFIIYGESMLPTYPAHGVTLGWCGAYWFSDIKVGDVIIARFDDQTAYLKRVVGMSGDTMEWVDGRLKRNGDFLDESYVVYSSDWNSSPILVDEGYIYVVGDNRSMKRDYHRHGQLLKSRVIGVPLW